MATRTRPRHNSFAYELHDRRPYTYFRQSLHRLSRLIDRRRAHTLSRHPLNLALSDLDDTSLSSLSLEKLVDAQSVTTFGSNETLDIKISSAEAPVVSTEPSLVSTGSKNILPFVGGKQAKLALSPSLRKGMEIAQIDIHFQNGQRISWRKPKNLMDLPEAIRKQFFRNAIVHDKKLFICGCHFCRASSVTATQPPLTRTSRAVRKATIPIFYQEHLFQHPLSHPAKNSVREWMDNIGVDNRALIRHLELAFLNAERAIESLRTHYHLRPAEDHVVVESVMWDDGQMGEVEWYVFAAQKPKELNAQALEDDVQSVGTSILFDQDDVYSAIDELEFEPDIPESEWETASSSSAKSSVQLVTPSTPPKVHLTRKNGEDFGEPRWSFAGKFNDHVVRRLASLHRDPAFRVDRKPVTFRLSPTMVMASDRGIDEVDDGKVDAERVAGVTETSLLARNKRYSSSSWVLKC